MWKLNLFLTSFCTLSLQSWKKQIPRTETLQRLSKVCDIVRARKQEVKLLLLFTQVKLDLSVLTLMQKNYWKVVTPFYVHCWFFFVDKNCKCFAAFGHWRPPTKVHCPQVCVCACEWLCVCGKVSGSLFAVDLNRKLYIKVNILIDSSWQLERTEWMHVELVMFACWGASGHYTMTRRWGSFY